MKLSVSMMGRSASSSTRSSSHTHFSSSSLRVSTFAALSLLLATSLLAPVAVNGEALRASAHRELGHSRGGSCPAGYGFSVRRGRVRCHLCAPGTASLGGMTSCEPCAPGSFAANSRSAKCEYCPVDTFTGTFGSSECEQCPIGWSTDGLKGSTGCVVGCELGEYFDGRKCLPCAADTYADELGLSRCKACPAKSGTRGETGSTSMDACLCHDGFFDATGRGGDGAVTCRTCSVCSTQDLFYESAACAQYSDTECSSRVVDGFPQQHRQATGNSAILAPSYPAETTRGKSGRSSPSTNGKVTDRAPSCGVHTDFQINAQGNNDHPIWYRIVDDSSAVAVDPFLMDDSDNGLVYRLLTGTVEDYPTDAVHRFTLQSHASRDASTAPIDGPWTPIRKTITVTKECAP